MANWLRVTEANHVGTKWAIREEEIDSFYEAGDLTIIIFKDRVSTLTVKESFAELCKIIHDMHSWIIR